MTSLKGQFLIAAASLTDPNFNRSVVLMLQHDEGGALGVVVNRPLDVTVRQACEQVLGVACDVDGPLHHGGPCEALMMVLFAVEPDADDDEADDAVLPGLKFTSDKQAIECLLRDGPPVNQGSAGMKVIVGYSGWGAGQLEGEMRSGSWLTVPATVARALGPAGPMWTRLVTEANLGKFIDPRRIPDDPSVN
jgi:putative transcriptional regulator